MLETCHGSFNQRPFVLIKTEAVVRAVTTHTVLGKHNMDLFHRAAGGSNLGFHIIPADAQHHIGIKRKFQV